MSSDALLAISRNLAIMAVFAVVLQVWLVSVFGRSAARRQVKLRLASHDELDVLPEEQESALVSGRLERTLVRAGVQLTQAKVLLYTVIVLTLSLGVAAIVGMKAALITPVAVLVLVFGYLRWRYQRRRREIYESLPGIVDNVIRSIDAGRSLEQALVASFADAPDVYEALVFRLRSAVDAGRDYTHLMDEFADLYEAPPLVFVAVALRTSSRFGSSIRPVLAQVSDSLRSQEQLRREFMAATAETRFTAAAFALFPPLIGVGLISLNANFRETLLHTSAGHKMLMMAGGLIAVAVVVIVRMVQGVGRD